MAFELMQEFVFDADAKTVRNYFLGGEDKEYRKIEITNGTFLFQGYLSFAPTPKAIYGGGMRIYICDGDRMDRSRLDDNIYWLVSEKDNVEIAIKQGQVGQCTMSLYAESDPKSWAITHGNPSLAYAVAMRFISEWWTKTIEGWTKLQAQPITSGDKVADGQAMKPLAGDSASKQPHITKVGKRSRYTQEEKDQAVTEWEALDKDHYGGKLEDFLGEKFGYHDKDDKLFVPKRTFYDWRDDYYERRPHLKKPHSNRTQAAQ